MRADADLDQGAVVAVRVIVAGAAAALLLAVLFLAQYHGVVPVLLAAVMLGAIGAMDRTDGQSRRFWAWAGTVAGALAMAALMLT